MSWALTARSRLLVGFSILLFWLVVLESVKIACGSSSLSLLCGSSFFNLLDLKLSGDDREFEAALILFTIHSSYRAVPADERRRHWPAG
jgi:hypothetical protein